MLELRFTPPSSPLSLRWGLPMSKSLMARRMILHTLVEGVPPAGEPIDEDTPEDIKSLLYALRASSGGEAVINVGESGTAMRFMTAYLAVAADRPCRLEGTARQHERPIAPLVEALRSLGADISYVDAEGFPPLYIVPSELHSGMVTLDASVSSQYLSALLLTAPRLRGRVEILLTHQLASAPYAYMTQSVLAEAGYLWQEVESGHFVYDPSILPRGSSSLGAYYRVEADWSAASYAYALVALLPLGTQCDLPQLALPSWQGDSLALPMLFERLEVYTETSGEGVRIYRVGEKQPLSFDADMSACPDLVPAVVSALVGRGIPFELTGIAHLRHKESDRLEALVSEVGKIGARLCADRDRLFWGGDMQEQASDDPPSTIDPHRDHRIAMALGLLALRVGRIRINHPEVVKKSFPSYWEQLGKVISLQRL